MSDVAERMMRSIVQDASAIVWLLGGAHLRGGKPLKPQFTSKIENRMLLVTKHLTKFGQDKFLH